jgi:hypothetical protein
MKRILLTHIFIFLGFTSHASANTPVVSVQSFNVGASIQQGLITGQYIILLRHALAPGFGDPINFDINACNTQRNLSQRGRQQAQKIGKQLKANGITKAAVFSSQWCRCLETARQLDLGEVTELRILNSFFQSPDQGPEQTRQLQAWLIENQSLQTPKEKSSSLPKVLVTHQVNITALTGVVPQSGELVIIKVDMSGEILVVARWETGY